MSSKKESYTNKRDIKTKVVAINILDDNMQQREKSLRQLFKENTHIKKSLRNLKKEIYSVQLLSTVRKVMKKQE